MDKRKYLLISLTACSLLICMCLISETYAKYVTTADSTTAAPIARWKILVNNQDVTMGTTSDSIITPVFPGTDNISNGVIAPNAEGYFDLILDASDVDVSFDYSILIRVNEESPISELVVTKYMIDGGSEIQVTDQLAPITGTMKIGETDRNKSIRIYLKWEDSLDLMTNEEDTAITQLEEAKLDVSISVIQTN